MALPKARGPCLEQAEDGGWRHQAIGNPRAAIAAASSFLPLLRPGWRARKSGIDPRGNPAGNNGWNCAFRSLHGVGVADT